MILRHIYSENSSSNDNGKNNNLKERLREKEIKILFIFAVNEGKEAGLISAVAKSGFLSRRSGATCL